MLADSVPTWTTKDGRVLQISSIGDEHLRNIIKMIKRNAMYYSLMLLTRLLQLIPSDAYVGGDEAYHRWLISSAKERYNRYFQEHPVYFHLLAEAERRGIDCTPASVTKSLQ